MWYEYLLPLIIAAAAGVCGYQLGWIRGRRAASQAALARGIAMCLGALREVLDEESERKARRAGHHSEMPP